MRWALVLVAVCPIGSGVCCTRGCDLHPPGKIVSVGGRGINFYCEGSGGPTVAFDAGFEDWSPAWAIVQPRIAKFARACSYDRPGSGFSDPGLVPRTSVRIAQDLHAALHAGGIQGPYVLVGHSFGSYNIRTFLDLYPSEVAAMVIVDGENGDVERPVRSRQDDAFLSAARPPVCAMPRGDQRRRAATQRALTGIASSFSVQSNLLSEDARSGILTGTERAYCTRIRDAKFALESNHFGGARNAGR